MFRNRPITLKLMAVILLTSGAVLLLTCGTFFVYELVTFRQSMVQSLSTLARAIATNSTAALAFENADDAAQVLEAVRADPHVVAAALYDRGGERFASYINPAADRVALPMHPDSDGYRFGRTSLALHEPVVIGSRRLGTLYLQSDLGAMYQRFMLYGAMVVGVIAAASLVAFMLATRLQRYITQPVLALAHTAKTVSEAQDYSVRAQRFDDDELGQLTDAFNAMLAQVQQRDQALRAQGDELRRSNADLEQYAYIASHDLQEPLRMVANYTDLLAERYRGRLDDRAEKYIHYVTDGAKRMQRLVSDLLAYSRVGSKTSRMQPVRMETVLQTVLDSLDPSIRETGATVEAVGPLPTVMADEVQLVQLLQNLIGNAIKFRSPRAPRVLIDAVLRDDRWQFSVQDNGIGIDLRYAERIFQMFQRLHERGLHEGSGIGLAIAKRIVERHGGRIWLESEVGVGTTFFFTLESSPHPA
jgi:signal transduction histidine kinase